MKNRIQNAGHGLVAGLLLLAATDVTGQTRSLAREGASPERRDEVSLLTADAPGRSIGNLVGQVVRNSEGYELGTVRDILVDVYSGNVAFAAIASGETLRLAPFAALQLTSPGSPTARIGQAEWEALQPVRSNEFETGKITLSASDRRVIAERFQQAEPPPPSEELAGHAVAPSGGSRLAALAKLRGRRVSTGTETVGTIGDILIDARSQTASAVLAPEPDFAPADLRFLIPMRQLNLAAQDNDPITTRLTRTDFDQAAKR